MKALGKDNFVKNSFLLTSANITTGVLGFIFSIYLSNLIGPEGMGLYSLVMPVYNLFICLMTAGIIAAISQITAGYEAVGDYTNTNRTIKLVSSFNIIWSVIIGVLVFLFAPYIAETFIKDPRVLDAIKVTCPAMVFIALSNILKGYFLGRSKITVPASIDILEKAMRIITLALLIAAFNASSIELMVTLAYVSLAIGEFQSLLLLFIYYKCEKKKAPNSHHARESSTQLLFNVLIISLPLCINGFLGNLFSMLSTLLVPFRLVAAGFERSVALGMIGKFTGMAMTIVAFPMIIISSINQLLIPDLSYTLSKGNYYEATVRIRQVIKIAFLIGLGTMIICNLIPNQLGEMFYGRSDLGSYIRFCSFCAPISFPSITMYGILNGLNKQGIILRNSIICSIIEIILLFILLPIPSINILGYGIVMVISSSIGFIINLHEVRKHLDLQLNKTNIIIFILIAALIFMILKISIGLIFPAYSIIKNIIIIAIVFGLIGYLTKFGLED